MDDVPLTLSGCVVAGEAKDSYPADQRRGGWHDLGADKRVLSLQHHQGSEGSRRAPRRSDEEKPTWTDVDKGKLQVRTEDGKVTTEVTSERREVKVEDAWFGSMGAMKLDAEVPTYKFEVDDGEAAGRAIAQARRSRGNCICQGSSPTSRLAGPETARQLY